MMIAELKKNLLSLNETIYFDNDQFLREKSANLPKLKEIIEKAETLLIEVDDEEKVDFLHGTLGNLYRIYGQPQKAIEYLTKCRKYAVENRNSKKEIVCLIRLGEALKYDNKHDKALNMFDEALDKCISINETIYLDFALQHKGKCLMELGRYDEAEESLLEALRIRKLKGDNDLVDSTQKAVELLKKLKVYVMPLQQTIT